LLKLDDNHPDLLHLLGVVAHQTGSFEAAVKLIDRAIARAGNVADYHNSRGLAALHLGRISEALANFNRAIALRPQFADAYSNRGRALKEVDRLDEAIQSYEEALVLNPRLAEAHNNLGNVLRQKGNLRRAVECWRQALMIRPDYPEALTNLGSGLTAVDRLDDAKAAFEASLRIRPADPDTLAQYSETLRLAGRFRESLDTARRGRGLDPAHEQLQVQEARALAALQQPEDALAAITQAAARHPENADIAAELAQMLEYAGKPAEAARAWHGALLRDADDADALAGLVALEGNNLSPDILARAERVAADDNHSSADRRVLHKALGDRADLAGDYAIAMAHYKSANLLRAAELKAQGIAFDPLSLRATVDRQIAVFDRAAMDRLRSLGSPTQVPIFVVGMPRSGTSLCEQILSSHAAVAGAGELNDIQAIARVLSRDEIGEPYPECVLLLDRPLAAKLADRYLARLRDVSQTASRVVDKHPINFRHLGLIASLFPQAAIIHCQRDPLDTCFSCLSQNFDAPIPWAVDQLALAAFYREYARLMAHWDKVLPGRIHRFVYEDVIGDMKTAAKALIQYCGLAWDPNCLAFHETNRVVRTASYRQVRQPIYSRSVGRWRKYEPFLQPLMAALHGRIDA
jgi:tetratricopeptide (TPR) repeat protein